LKSRLIHGADAGGRRLAVEFFWTGDRYAHRVFVETGTDATPALAQPTRTVVAESLEGDGEIAWPPSPPLTQCSVETDNAGRPIALLVGMAGVSHWSLTCRAVEKEGTPAMEFDVACRAKAPPTFLGSTYATPNNAVAIDFTSGEDTHISRADHRLRVTPNAMASAAEFAQPRTLCWRYYVTRRVCNASD